uniref:Uncharacterized protein n=1 Tax=Rhizophagus irregularis (strain DAOM 181602 / DAOM 197198 / MUCL 43194) TaxID=747089 RepID=U9SW27_RHIID
MFYGRLNYIIVKIPCSPRPLEKKKSGRGSGRKSERKKPEGTIKKRFNVGGRNARL